MEHSIHILVSIFIIPGLLFVNSKTPKKSVQYRLVGGASDCHGDLEMKQQNGAWKPVDGLNWYRMLANRVCAELDCGSVVSVKLRNTKSLKENWRIISGCDKPSPSDCFKSEKYLYSFLELSCSDSVRLLNGSSLCSGRLEVRSTQSSSWSSVCQGQLDLTAAKVVCRELGCGPPEPLQGALSEVNVFQCEGHESALLDCGRSASQTCSSGTAVDLTCADLDDVKLVGQASHCNGTVQIKHHGKWKYIEHGSYSTDPWTLKAADVICRRLDCGSVVSVTEGSYGPLWPISPTCFHSTSALTDCVKTDSGLTDLTQFLTCSDSVRLVSGYSRCSGTLEVRFNQIWWSVCEEDLDLKDAQVVCRQLGCKAPKLLQGRLYGEGMAPVGAPEFQCEGNEFTVLNCRRLNSARKTCSKGTAAVLTCTDPIALRLVGQTNRCAGALEIQYQGEWKPVDDYDKQWNVEFASTVCKVLGCGSAVSVTTTTTSTRRATWGVSLRCVNLTSGLMDCVSLYTSSFGSYGVDMVCSGLLPQPNISLSDGVSQPYQQGFRVLVCSDFTITCSIQPQYSRGSFQLISHTYKPLNLTLPAVNHSAHFLLSNMGRQHRGNYMCVYHVNISNHTVSSPQSSALYLTIGDLERNLIIRMVVILLALLIFDLSLFFFYKVSMRRIQIKADTRTAKVLE